MRLTIITGMSGSGKTQVMRYFEDIGFFCIDNMPPVLIPKLLELFASVNGQNNNIALVIDVRVGSMITELLNQIQLLRDNGYKCSVLFLDAADDVLVKRYKETRRSHPVNSERGLLDSIQKERELMKGLYAAADHIIDTSNLSIHRLYQNLKEFYGGRQISENFQINVMAFGFKFGMPLDADLVFDVRCFPNPFYVDELKHKTGNDREVQDYVMKYPQSRTFMEKLQDMMYFMIPLYIEEGKTSLTIAIGCTGGKHRSVTMANRLGEYLTTKGYEVRLHYRDIERK